MSSGPPRLRLAFLGSPLAAATSLRALVDAGHDIVLVVTRPDKRRGRRAAPGPTPVKTLACELGLPVSHDVGEAVAVGAELGVVVAFGRIISADVLAALPMINLHFSLLPRWRGAAPVERAILAGDRETGVCVMEVAEGLDTGGIYRSNSILIGPDETAAELTARLAATGADLLVAALSEGLGTPASQVGEAVYAAKISPDELGLDWSRPAVELHRVVRVGRAWTTWRGGRLLVVRARQVDRPGWPAAGGEYGVIGADGAVSTGDGTIQLLRVQPEGRHPLAVEEWLRGARPQPGERLGA